MESSIVFRQFVGTCRCGSMVYVKDGNTQYCNKCNRQADLCDCTNEVFD